MHGIWTISIVTSNKKPTRGVKYSFRCFQVNRFAISLQLAISSHRFAPHRLAFCLCARILSRPKLHLYKPLFGTQNQGTCFTVALFQYYFAGGRETLPSLNYYQQSIHLTVVCDGQRSNHKNLCNLIVLFYALYFWDPAKGSKKTCTRFVWKKLHLNVCVKIPQS